MADGWMCKVSFEDELENASDGVRIFPSEATLRRYSRCVDQCGIVRVNVTLAETVQEENFDAIIGKQHSEPVSLGRAIQVINGLQSILVANGRGFADGIHRQMAAKFMEDAKTQGLI